jgi:hypothetical protein
LKGKPDEAVYRLKKEVLGRFEKFSQKGWLDLYYGDEAGVNLDATSAIRLAVSGRRGFDAV